MSKTRLNIDYNFRASDKTDPETTKQHLCRLGMGHTYMLKDVNIDKLKLDSEAINILTAACETVALAIEASKKNKPFFLSIGEQHNMPAHYIHHMLTIEGLERAGIDFKVSCEYKENAIKYSYLKSLKEMLGDHFNLIKAMKCYRNSDINLRMLFQTNFGMAPYSNKVLNNFLIDTNKNKTVGLTDAPRFLVNGKYSVFFDIRSPGVRRALSYLNPDNYFSKLLKNGKIPLIPFKSEFGMAVRNIFTVMQAVKAPSNVVHIAGRAHVDDIDPENANKNVLSVYADYFDFHPVDRVLLTPEHDATSAQLYPDILFPNKSFLSPAIPFSGYEADEDERTYMNTKLKSLGHEHWCFNTSEIRLAKMLACISEKGTSFDNLKIVEHLHQASVYKDITKIAEELRQDLPSCKTAAGIYPTPA